MSWSQPFDISLPSTITAVGEDDAVPFTGPSVLPGRWRTCTCLCESLSFLLPFRCFSGFYCWNAAAAHIAPACWSYYDHRLPWRDPNEDAEDACFASCCFQSGYRWVRHISCFVCCCKKKKIANTCYELRQHIEAYASYDKAYSFVHVVYWGFEHWELKFLLSTSQLN